MKKSILTAILAGVMLLSGCSGVSEESYNSVVAENERLKSENNSLKSDNESLSISNKVNEDLLKEYGETIHELQTQLQSQSEVGNPPSEPKLTAVYEDEFVKISYAGIGKGASFPFEDRECIIFNVENKTQSTLEFLPNSISLDENDVGNLTCNDKIAPQSNGKIYLLKMSSTDKYFNNKTPSRISGDLSVKDYSDIGTFGNNWWHKISFINVEI